MGACGRTASCEGMTDQGHFLCKLEEIRDGNSKGVAPDSRGRDRVMLVRQGARVYAYVNSCPHYDRAPMAWKKDEFLNGEKTSISCAAHGALFRITDGVCEIGPCLGQSLTRVEVTLQGSDIFAKTLPEDRHLARDAMRASQAAQRTAEHELKDTE